MKSGHLRRLVTFCLLASVLTACIAAPMTPAPAPSAPTIEPALPAQTTAEPATPVPAEPEAEPTASSPAAAPAAGSLEGTFWILALYPDATGQMVSVLPDSRANIEFSGGQVTGNATCNLYNGTYQQVDDSLTIALAARTLMACEDPLMAQEDAYLAALTQAASQRTTGNKLDILNTEGAVILSFIAEATPVLTEAAPAPAETTVALTGTEWQVIEYNNGRDGLVSVMAGTTITVTFGADGHMGGTAGCNGFGAPYTLDGDKLTIDSIFSTMMFCTEPEGILDQEADFLAALAKTAAYAIEDDRLTLTAADASPVLTAVGAAAEAAPPAEATAVPEAAPPPAATETVAEAPAEEAPVAPAPVTVPTDAALLGQVWQWQETTLADGSVVKVGAPQRYTVQFMDDGIVIGRADCNRAGGIYSVADGALKLKVGVLTRAACPPGSLSTQFVQALNSAATYRFDGDNLVIELRDGAGVMLLIGAK